MDNKKITLFVVCAIILAGLLFWWLRPDDQAHAPETQTNESTEQTENSGDNNGETATNTLPPTNNSLLVSTQIAGNYVTIDNIYLEEPAFIVIHEADGTTPGKKIGNSGLINTGAGQDLEVNAELVADKDYYAILYKDNGDRTFNPANDEPLLGSDGKPVMAMFQVSN